MVTLTWHACKYKVHKPNHQSSENRPGIKELRAETSCKSWSEGLPNYSDRPGIKELRAETSCKSRSEGLPNYSEQTRDQGAEGRNIMQIPIWGSAKLLRTDQESRSWGQKHHANPDLRVCRTTQNRPGNKELRAEMLCESWPDRLEKIPRTDQESMSSWGHIVWILIWWTTKTLRTDHG